MRHFRSVNPLRAPTRPTLPRNTPATGLERNTTFFHWQQQGIRSGGGYQWFSVYGNTWDFTDANGAIMRFY